MMLKPNHLFSLFSVLLYIISTSSCCLAQNKSNNSLYQTWVKVNQTQQVEKGWLFAVSSGSMEVIKNEGKPYAELDEQQAHSIPFQDISELKIRKKGAVGKGAAKGALIGLGIGIIGGLLLKASERSKGLSVGEGWGGAYIISTSIVFVPLGALVGLAVGGSKRKIPIQTNPQFFNDNKIILEAYVASE